LRSKLLEARGKEIDLQVLTAQRDAGLAQTSYDNAVDKTWKWWDAADEEGGDSAPVGAKFRRVAVDAVEVIHVGYGHITTSYNVVAMARIEQISGC
jgi:hypothetical protein